ncbi:bifunctional non-homologous end joining protein LigD [Luteibacter sp. Sphag1AF]|uniref:DNA ligase D n=1 Tax=Luteibacter sp. Sphag1AF TaxID=2587031 RepID=UPI0016230356|nr:DNA ligase D [Luteibacter sp. Sphag1AF]MBB3226749.1 bifunctional non-homologous end joining protein LigD [Luteibacter sp. Sphag1AF]
MTLANYRRKRDFSRTREPAPDHPAPAAARAIFVVQLHHASRRHFDFRLQVGDTLRSWAVPKGPSFDPTVKRLAVEVEDHPVAYADFEGDIEEGYGKGHVDLFDRGVWSTQGDAEAQLRKGHLHFHLDGQRLKGGWHLVRSGKKERQPAWFLIKDADAWASDVEADDLLDATMVRSTRKAARTPNEKKAASKLSVARRPTRPVKRRASAASMRKALAAMQGARGADVPSGFFAPELAKLHDTPPNGPNWLHEVKWDGYRLLASITDGEVTLWSRNGLAWNDKVPEITSAIRDLKLDSARLDGELIALDSHGRSDFNALQRTLSGEAQAPLVYMLFDMPALLGYDLTRASLLDRKALLKRVVEHTPAHLGFSDHHLNDGDAVFQMAMDQQLEGIMSKRVDSGYRAGRSEDWLKIKRLQSDEFAVIGYTPAKGARLAFGSLLLGRPGEGDQWTYMGRVGTGFTDGQLKQLGETLATKGTREPPIRLNNIDPLLKGALWIKPTTVAEVWFRGIGNHGLLRQPSLKTLRMDKRPMDLRGNEPMPDTPRKIAKNKGKTRSPVVITHPDRVVFPEDNITKQQVADYYHTVMPWLLPGIVNRPTSTIRCPGGIGEHCFFQKHLIAGLEYAGAAKIKEETGATATWLYPKNEESVIELVQFGAIEFHPWGSTVATPDIADRIVFDLDPGEGVSWARVVAAARQVRTLLTAIGLVSFVRTTGGKGLHVVVPLNPGSPWDLVKSFARGFAEALAGMHPLEFVATSAKRLRNGKIYLDYLRNGRGATSVASYSLRARAGAPASVPLRWEELDKIKSGSAFNIHTLPKRLARLRADPWEGFDDVRQSLESLTFQAGQADATS